MGKFLTIFHALADTTKNETRRYRACTGVTPTPFGFECSGKDNKRWF